MDHCTLTQRWTCQGCGTACERPVTRGQRPKWCSQRCRDLARKGQRAACAECGIEFFGMGKVYCSPQCHGRSRRRCRDLVCVAPSERRSRYPSTAPATVLPKAWGVVVSGPCSWCGEQFTAITGSGVALFCSKRCSRDEKRSASRFQVSPVLRLAIYERDNWTCQLCFDPVDPDAHYLSDWFPSLDHIIPQSVDPDHSAENLRTAHRWCNAVRGDGTYHADLFEEAPCLTSPPTTT